MSEVPRVDDLLAGKDPAVRQIYQRLVTALERLGPLTEEANRSSVHLKPAAEAPAFAGVHFRRAGLLLNVRGDAAIESPRVRKVEQVSRSRFHNEMLLASPADVDGELLGWLKAARALSSGPPAPRARRG
jgi:hypothetical protein